MSSTIESALQADIDIMSAWNWNGTSYVPPVIDALIHKQFQKQVEEQPDSEAICAWDGSLTYSELDWLSSALAGFLQETYNLGNGTLIPLCFEKSKWNVVAMLAILKSGCACVPMDPAHPMERMQTIFELLGSDFSYVVLSSLTAGRRLSALNCRINDYEVEFLGIDQTFFDELDQEHFAYFNKQFGTPDQETNTPALVVFTSGSTGTPKGIVQEHRGYCSAADYHGAALSYGKESRVFQFAAHTFDVSLCDILTTLIHGGCICIPSDEERMNDLSGAIKRLRANHLPFTPTVATMIRPEDVLPEVKWMTLGGEALSREAMNIWADHVNLIQAYGPAEAGVDCTVRQNVKKEDSPNNLGRPIGSSIWIVNPEDHNQLVPIGTEGELLIEGPIVARGYLGNDALTDKSFITDPEWVQLTKVTCGRRFYKTGDLGYFAPNGDIHIVGRNDSQVKLRGQRLEIGEVEHHLRVAVGDSAQIAVAAVTPNGGAKILAAFIAMNGSDAGENHSDLLAVSPDQLEKFRDAVKTAKEQLKDNLPSYMLPTAYIPIQKIPLSASGKVERKHLCSLAEALTTRDFANFVGHAETVVDTVAHSTHHEEVLHKAWKESLSVENFGIDDNFFYLGGDSARAMILVSCLRNHGFALTVADIIRNPVLKDQAKQLKQKIDVADVAPFSQVAEREEERNAIRLHAAKVCGVDTNRVLDVFPITEMQERFFRGAYLGGPFSLWAHQARFMHDSARQMIFDITGDLDVRRFFKAWHAVNERHSILRTRFIQKKDTRQILQVVVDDPIHIWTSCDPLSEDFLQRDRRVKMTWGAPLIRITASQEHRWVVLTISHAIYDGFSLDLIFKEVKREYDQAAGAKPAIEMNHFMKYLGDGDKQAALAFWRNHFAGADVKPVVPHDRLDEETVQNVVKRATVKLDGDLPAGAPNRSMILQVSAALFLAHRLDCADIIFDNHLSGRTGTLPGVEVLVGPTLTSLATRVHIGRDADAPVRNILSETQNFMNTVSEHEHMGWWKLVQMDEFRELLHGAPLLNVMPGPDMTGRDLGLELKKTNSQNEAPYGVMATLVDDNTIELLVCSDKRCVPEAEVEKDLKRWQIALKQVWASCAAAGEDQLTVGDVFSRLQDLA